ncbi:hypothetical protein E5D57_008516 [Metarhizium anisopliae]|nr:hypothetical protein E5D57_008516 [Metarhizium anisopliae]
MPEQCGAEEGDDVADVVDEPSQEGRVCVAQSNLDFDTCHGLPESRPGGGRVSGNNDGGRFRQNDFLPDPEPCEPRSGKELLDRQPLSLLFVSGGVETYIGSDVVEYLQSCRAVVFFWSKPNDDPVRFSIYFAHEKNLGRSLDKIVLVYADGVTPEVSRLVLSSEMSQGSC